MTGRKAVYHIDSFVQNCSVMQTSATHTLPNSYLLHSVHCLCPFHHFLNQLDLTVSQTMVVTHMGVAGVGRPPSFDPVMWEELHTLNHIIVMGP